MKKLNRFEVNASVFAIFDAHREVWGEQRWLAGGNSRAPVGHAVAAKCGGKKGWRCRKVEMIVEETSQINRRVTRKLK